MHLINKLFDTMFISDAHLMSENCQAELLLNTLRSCNFRRLVICGDLVEDDKIPLRRAKMNWHQFRVIEHLLRKMKKGGGGIEIARIKGNHDPQKYDLVNEILGIKSQRKHVWRQNGRKYCAIHGHQFDRFLFRNPTMSRIASAIFLFLQKIDTKRRSFTRWIDRFHCRWLRLAEAVAEGAKNYAIKRGIDAIICGHVHQTGHIKFIEGGKQVDYYNCGDWTGHTCSFLTMDGDGQMQLHTLSPEPKIFRIRRPAG